MKINIKTTISKIITSKFSLVFVATLAVLLVPVVTSAWGPERATFTQASPATYVTFNSITDDPTWGDERNFYRVRDVSTGEKYSDNANLKSGGEYEVSIFFHNNAASNFNESGTGIAHGAYARADLPPIVKAGQKDVESNAYVGATNANPASVYDYIRLTNATDTDMSIRLIPGSVKFTSQGAHNGATLTDTAVFSAAGQPLGFDNLDGNLPGCDHYSGIVTFRFTAIQPGFTFTKDVRMSGTKDWNDAISAKPGDKVQYRLAYTNTGTSLQKDVAMKDVLPEGIDYVKGSAKLYNSSNPNGKAIDDGISQGGTTIGDYNAKSNAFLLFDATVGNKPCTTLTNTAYVETNNGSLQDTAGVTVTGDCVAALPTTGPAEVVAGLIGVGALTFGIVYYLKSRRELEATVTQVAKGGTSFKGYTSLADVIDDVKKKPLHKRILRRRKK